MIKKDRKDRKEERRWIEIERIYRKIERKIERKIDRIDRKDI